LVSMSTARWSISRMHKVINLSLCESGEGKGQQLVFCFSTSNVFYSSHRA
jgi:hypothetical protein